MNDILHQRHLVEARVEKIRNDKLEFSFKEINIIVYDDTFMNYHYWNIPLTVNNDDY